MGARYIDVNKLIKLMGETNTSILTADEIDEYADTQSEDVGLIIRCKDCKFWSEPNMFDSYCKKISIIGNIIYTDQNHYCGFAKTSEKLKNCMADGKSTGYHKCINCKWYERFVGVCTCADSEWRADFRDDDNVCERWEDKYGKTD